MLKAAVQRRETAFKRQRECECSHRADGWFNYRLNQTYERRHAAFWSLFCLGVCLKSTLSCAFTFTSGSVMCGGGGDSVSSQTSIWHLNLKWAQAPCVRSLMDLFWNHGWFPIGVAKGETYIHTHTCMQLRECWTVCQECDFTQRVSGMTPA